MGQRMSSGTKRSPWKRDVTPNRSTICNGRCGCCAVRAEVSKSDDIGRQGTKVGPRKTVVRHTNLRIRIPKSEIRAPLQAQDFTFAVIYRSYCCSLTRDCNPGIPNPVIGSVAILGFRNYNKKSEPVLMRRARAYSSSCLRVILVYLYHFVAIHSFAAKNCQKIT